MLELAITLIFWVESRNNPNPDPGDGGAAHGIAQIHQEVLDDVNERYHTKYTRKDCYDPVKAREIARKYLVMWRGENASLMDYCRTWNGGPYWFKKPANVKARTLAYWNKCKKAMKEIT